MGHANRGAAAGMVEAFVPQYLFKDMSSAHKLPSSPEVPANLPDRPGGSALSIQSQLDLEAGYLWLEAVNHLPHGGDGQPRIAMSKNVPRMQILRGTSCSATKLGG